MIDNFDVIVIGAGAAGLMAASTAGRRGRKVLLIENSNKIGEKIRISGGGRCNFTNLGTSPKCFLSRNPHFVISALSQYTQKDFINLIESYNIAYHEKTLGQLFCDGSSKQIIDMLVNECTQNNVTINMNCNVLDIGKTDQFLVNTNMGKFESNSLIIATGGLAIPKISTDFGYVIANKFNINIISTCPALVPLIVENNNHNYLKELSGIAIPVIVNYGKMSFKENILLTHKGLSGPAILQISSYLDYSTDQTISINLLPDIDIYNEFKNNKESKTTTANFLKDYLPKRFIEKCELFNLSTKKIIDYKLSDLNLLATQLHNFSITTNGNEGYQKAEVTGGGINTQELSSKTMESVKVKGLYFVGEVVDVTGWLGGYNFQWAWSSGYVAGMNA